MVNGGPLWPSVGNSTYLRLLASTSVNGGSTCSYISTSTTRLQITAQAPLADAGTAIASCGNDDVVLSGSYSGAATSATWTTSGTGTFLDPNFVGTTYSPSGSDVASGTVTLTLTTNDPTGVCGVDSDEMVITLGNGAIQSTSPADGTLTRCEGANAILRVNFSSPSNQIPIIEWQLSGVPVSGSNYDILDAGSTTQSRLRINDVTGLNGSVFTAIVTYPGCDPESRDFTLTVTPGPTADVGGPYAAVCENGTISLDGTVGGSATTGTWSTAAGDGLFTNIDLASANATYTPGTNDKANGNVSLTLTSNGAVSGCPVVPISVIVDIHSLTTNAITPATQTQCDGETVTITSTWTEGPTTPAATASWEVNDGSGWVAYSGGSVDNMTLLQSVHTFTASGSMSGHQFRSVVTAGACTKESSPMTLIVNGPATFDTHPVSVLDECQSTTEMTFTASATSSAGTLSYRWYYSNNGTSWSAVPNTVTGYNTTTLTVDSGDGAAWPTIGSATGKYYRLAANLPGCSNFYHSDAAQFTISADPAPYVMVPADAIQCMGTTATLAGAILGSATSATWSHNGNGTIDLPANYSGAVYTPGANETGEVTFTLTSNDPVGHCPSAIDSFTITYIKVDAGSDINVCIDGSVFNPILLNGSVTGLTSPTIVWNDNGAGGTFDDITSLTAAYTPTSSASPITLTLTSNGCSDNVMVIFNENITNVTLIGAVVKNVCVGSGTSFRVNFDPATGVTRTWQYSADGLDWTDLVIAAPFSVSSPGTSDTQLNLLSSGSNTGASLAMQGFYRVVLTNGECMIESDPFTLNVSEITSASLNSGDNLAICETETDVTVMGEAVSSGYGTASYRLRYRIGGGTWTNLGGSSTTPSFTLSSGLAWDVALHSSGTTVELQLRVTLGGCTFDSDPIAFTRDAAAIVMAGLDQTICSNSTATLAGSYSGATTSITWSSDNTNGSFDDATAIGAIYTPGVPGTHTLSITSDDPIGACPAASDQVIITVEELPVVNAGIDQAICQVGGPNPVSLSGSVTPASAALTWTASSGTFDDANMAITNYTPDGSVQQVTLTLTANAQVACPAVSDNVIISLGDGIVLSSYTPGGITAGSHTVCDGGNATFRVDYDATVLASRQWQINDGSGWVNLPIDASAYGIGGWSVMSSDLYAELILTGLDVMANGLQIQVIVTDRGCQETFGVFTLHVNGPVTFSTQPIDQEVCSTATMATFTGVAQNAGAGGTPTYQWQYYNGTSWVNVPNTVAGYNGTSLFLTNAASFWPAAGSSVDLKLKATIPVCGSTYSDIITLSRTTVSCDAIPDLTPTIPRPLNANFTAGQTKEGYIQLSNIGTGNTSGTITFTVSKVNNFTLSIPASMTSAAGTTVNNGDWSITPGLFSWIITAPANVIAPGQSSKIGYILTRAGAAQAGTTGTMTVTLTANSGMETNTANNIISKTFTNI